MQRVVESPGISERIGGIATLRSEERSQVKLLDRANRDAAASPSARMPGLPPSANLEVRDAERRRTTLSLCLADRRRSGVDCRYLAVRRPEFVHQPDRQARSV